MEVTVLGASGGYPEPGRPCSGYLVEAEGIRLLLDVGAGTLQRLLEIVDPWELDAIWISHLHPDHWTDLPITLHRMAVTASRWDRPPVEVHGPEDWEGATGVGRQWYATELRPFVARTLHDGASFDLGRLRVLSRAMCHGMEAYGVRVEGPDGVLAYSGDTAPCAALTELAVEADLFLCEATLPPGDTTAISMNAEQAAAVAAEAQVRRLVLTHLLPGVDPDAARRAAESVLGRDVQVVAPGQRLSV